MNGRKVDLKAVPNIIWVSLTVCFLGIVTAFVVLSVTHADGTEFRSFLNTVLNIGTLIVTGGGAVYAGAAAKNAQVAKEQTNGQLDKRIATQVAQELVKHGLVKTEVRDDGGQAV